LDINAKGNLNVNAVNDKSSSDSKSVQMELGFEKSSGGSNVSGGGNVDLSKSKSSTHQLASFKSGGNMNLNSGKKMKFEGSKLESNGDMSLTAKNGIDFKSVTDKKSEKHLKASGSYDGGLDDVNADAGLKYEETHKGVNIKAKNLNIKTGGTLKQEGTKFTLSGNKNIKADKVIKKSLKKINI